jgi:hypothetical protein
VKKLVTAVMVAAIATPVCAQMGPPNVLGEGTKLKTDVEIKQERDRENGFKSGLSKIPDAPKGKVDPWGNVRSSPPAQSQNAKSAPK